MPNCDFYAVPDDWLQIVRFIFTNDGWILYELSSMFDCEVRSFRSVDDVKALLRSDEESYHFDLYSPEMGGSVQFRRIELNPGAVPGKTFRYATEGAGLIQFYVSQPRDGKLRPCHTNHFSMRGAEKSDLGSVSDWNWRHITSMSNRLNRYIRSEAVAKRGSRPILAGAQSAFVSAKIELLGF
jgi:hypothetical protein